MIKAVLFDFHNTLVTCDSWLDLEIHTLPALALERLAEKGYLPEGQAASPAATEKATQLFHDVRQEGATSV